MGPDDFKRMEATLQTAADDSGPLHAGGNVLVQRQPALGLQRAWLGNPGTAGRQVLSETPPRGRDCAPTGVARGAPVGRLPRAKGVAPHTGAVQGCGRLPRATTNTASAVT